MRHFTGFLIWMLIAAQQSGTVKMSGPQPIDMQVGHDVLAGDQRLEYTFLDVLRGTGLHGGFVEVANCEDRPKGNLQIKQGATVRQAMDALVAANPRFRWELNDGTVNLIPRGGIPLLRTRIAKFQMSATDQDVLVVIGDLLNLPEVRARGAALGMAQGPGQVGLFSGESHPVPRERVEVHVDVENLSLQDALNKIVQLSPKAIWIYHETDCDGVKTFTVDVATDY